MDVLVRIFRLQEQELGHQQIGHVVLNRPDQEHHAFLEQAGIDVVGTLAPGGLLDHHRYELRHGLVTICAIAVRAHR